MQIDKGLKKRSALHSALYWLLALGLWQIYSNFVPAYLIPSPMAVLTRLMDFLSDSELAFALALSLFHVFSAIVIAFCLGGLFAFLPVVLPITEFLVDKRLTPFLSAFSGIGWLFMAILWFGIDSGTVIFTVAMVLTPFAIVNLRTGLLELDRDLLELGRSIHRSRFREFKKIVVPMLAPYGFATLRTSFGVSWKVVLTAELFGGSGGMGYLLNAARQEFDTETIFAVIVFMVLFVALSEMLFFRKIQAKIDARYGHE